MPAPSRRDLIALSELPTVPMKESLYPETLVGVLGPSRRAQSFQRISIALGLAVTAFTVYHLLEPDKMRLALPINAFVLAAIVVSYVLRPRIGEVPGGALLLAGWAVHTAAVGWLHGGLVVPAVTLLSITPWLGAHLLGRRGAVAFAGVCLCIVGGLFVHELISHQRADGLVLRFVYAVAGVLVGTGVGLLQERSRTQAKASLERATERASAMLGALPDTFVLLSPLGEILEARVPPDSVLGGLSRLINHRIHVMLDPREATRFQQCLDQVSSTDTPVTIELRMLLAGNIIDIEARVSAHPEGDLVALLRDISLQKRSRRIKDEFVSTVSHELRTPLTSIHGSLALLRSGTLGSLSDDALGVVELAWRNSDRLRRLIDDLLDVQKMESGRLDLRLGTFDLGQLLINAVDANRLYARQFGVELRLTAPPEPLTVRVDDDRFHQVVSNLLSNAIKYSPDDGTVDVTTAQRERHVRICVRDRGRGIPEDFRPHVFDTFAQADSSETRLVGGTGLGLSICKRLVTAFGGTIGFDSETGEGTIFWFELPRRMPSMTASADG